MALRYRRGVDWVRSVWKSWDALGGAVDPECHEEVATRLAIQERDAVWWRNACLLYFQTFSRRPLPAGVERPAKTLEEYAAQSLLDRRLGEPAA